MKGSSLIALGALVCTGLWARPINVNLFFDTVALSYDNRSRPTRSLHIDEINTLYDSLEGASAQDRADATLMRSEWAKSTLEFLLTRELQSVKTSESFEALLGAVEKVRSLIPSAGVKALVQVQRAVGSPRSARRLSMALADFADPADALGALAQLPPHPAAFRRLGPPVIKQFRPMRKTLLFDPEAWTHDPLYSEVEFVRGNPDQVRIRGVELHSGDLGGFILNHPGDGILDSFLKEPGALTHVMLFVTLRVPSKKVPGGVLFQPAVIEIYDGGWRRLPLATALSPHFSWYSEWVRPRNLPADIGEKLSRTISEMEVISFDFQARPLPPGGVFPLEPDQPCTTCPNLARLPYERLGFSFPYPRTPVSAGAALNLEKLGLPVKAIHTPSNLVYDCGFSRVGVVDNGRPEWILAQALVAGRPRIVDSLGGLIENHPLDVDKLPRAKAQSVSDYLLQMRHLQSSLTAYWVGLGQSDSSFASAVRSWVGVDAKEVPRSASAPTIAFYLIHDRVAASITEKLCPSVLGAMGNSPVLLSAFQEDSRFRPRIGEEIRRSVIAREGWYGHAP